MDFRDLLIMDHQTGQPVNDSHPDRRRDDRWTNVYASITEEESPLHGRLFRYRIEVRLNGRIYHQTYLMDRSTPSFATRTKQLVLDHLVRRMDENLPDKDEDSGVY